MKALGVNTGVNRVKLTNTIINSITTSSKQRHDKVSRVWDTAVPGFHVYIPKSGKGVYYYRYKIDSLPYSFRIAAIDKISLTAARARAKQLQADVQNGLNPHKLKLSNRITGKNAKSKPDMQTLGGFIANWYADYCKANLKDHRARISCLDRNFKQWYKLPLKEITPAMVTGWRTKQINGGRFSPGGANRPCAYLKALLNCAVREAEVLEYNPLANLKMIPETRGVRQRFINQSDASEFERILSTLKKRDNYLLPLFLLTIHTGLRISETLSLKWKNVDFTRQLITIESRYAKSKRQRSIPMNDSVTHDIKKWKLKAPPGEYVFTNPRTNTKYSDVRWLWLKVMEEANVKDFQKRDLRRSFASFLGCKNVSIHKISTLLGHSNVDVTKRSYSFLTDDSLRSATDLMEELG